MSKEVVADSASAKQLLLEWVQLIKQERKFYLVKAMDIFAQLEEQHQKGLIELIAEKVGNEDWKKDAEDNTKYSDVIRNILFYFTGREKLQQPSKTEFAGLLRDYFNQIKAEKESLVKLKKAKEFSKELSAL